MYSAEMPADWREVMVSLHVGHLDPCCS